MAMRKISEEGKVFKYLNPHGEEVLCPPKTEYPELEERLMKLNPSPDQRVLHNTLAEPWFKPKTGSVIPAKRRLVKSMMFDQILQWFCSVSDSDTSNSPCSNSAGVSETDKSHTSNPKKIISSQVYPTPI